MSVLVGFVDKFVDIAVDAFNDPIGAIEDLWAALRDNIVNRFEGIISLFQATGKGLKALWERDLPKLGEAAEEAGQAIVQMSTGLDPEQQKQFAEGVKGITEEIFRQTQAYIDLADARRQTIRQNRELEKALQSVITEEGRLRIIADDTTRSIKEREEAAEAARVANEQRAALELQIAQGNLNLINDEIAARRSQKMDVEDLLDQQLQAFVELKSAERDYTLTVQENEKIRRELIQDRLERDLDLFIDIFDNQKTINERIIADETIAASERRKLLEETKKLADDSFAEQIATIQKFTDVQLDSNEIINESNLLVLREKLRQLGVSDTVEGRILEIVRDRRMAVADLVQAEKELTKEVMERRQAEAAPLEMLPQQGQDQDLGIEVDYTVGQSDEEGLFDRLGIGDAEQEQLKNSIDFAKGKIGELAQARVQAAEAAVQASEREVQAAQAALQAEITAAEQGQAANIEARQEELKAAEQQQEEALQQRQRAQRAQLAIDTVTQASSLITAASKILKDVPFPLNIAAVGTMFGSFALAKIKAFQATKIFRDGGLEFLDYGGSHESGNDIFIGTDGHGSQMRAERGEAMAVINRKATSRYRSVLPAIIDSLNSQSFERQFSYMGQAAQIVPVVSQSVNVDTRRMEGHLSAIRQNGAEQYYTDSRGRMVRRRGNKRTIYV